MSGAVFEFVAAPRFFATDEGEIRGDTAMRGKRAGAPRRGCLPERVPGVGRAGGARPIETGREECGREWCLLAKCSKPFENADPFFLRSFREPRRTALPFKPRSGTRPPSGYAGGEGRAAGAGPRATAESLSQIVQLYT